MTGAAREVGGEFHVVAVGVGFTHEDVDVMEHGADFSGWFAKP